MTVKVSNVNLKARPATGTFEKLGYMQINYFTLSGWMGPLANSQHGPVV
jgi:hypothetical protein